MKRNFFLIRTALVVSAAGALTYFVGFFPLGAAFAPEVERRVRAAMGSGPWTLERLDIRGTLWELYLRRQWTVSVEISGGGSRWRIEGPARWQQAPGLVWIELTARASGQGEIAGAAEIGLRSSIDTASLRPRDVELQISRAEIQWRAVKVSGIEGRGRAGLTPEVRLEGELSAATVEGGLAPWSGQATGLRLDLSGPMSALVGQLRWSGLTAGTADGRRMLGVQASELSWRWGGALTSQLWLKFAPGDIEWLDGNFYLAPEMRNVTLEINSDNPVDGFDFFGQRPRSWRVTGRLRAPLTAPRLDARYHVRMDSTWPWLAAMASLADAPLATSGIVDGDLGIANLRVGDREELHFKTQGRWHEPSARWATHGGFSGGEIAWRFDTRKGGDLRLRKPALGWRALRVVGPDTRLTLSRREAWVVGDSRERSWNAPGLSWNLKPWQWTAGNEGPLTGAVFRGGIVADSPDLRDPLRRLCVDTSAIPAIGLMLNWPSVVWRYGHLETDGFAMASLWGGFLRAQGLRIFRVLSPVPEVQVAFDWDGLQLGQIGDFYGIGRMDGLLQGFAKDVVAQALLPTQFRFDFRLRPRRGRQIVFSPRAMQNTVRLITPQDFSRDIPGVMNWLAFGWPSEVLGGYNIDYAGVSLYSQGGSILLETVDSDLQGMASGGRHLLFGPRFRFPLRSPTYPVVLDTRGMVNFVGHVRQQLTALQSQANLSDSPRSSYEECRSTPSPEPSATE